MCHLLLVSTALVKFTFVSTIQRAISRKREELERLFQGHFEVFFMLFRIFPHIKYMWFV